jgi:hypothetical protein
MWQSGKADWKLLRVGVVELTNDVFVARLFFGERIQGGFGSARASRATAWPAFELLRSN